MDEYYMDRDPSSLTHYGVLGMKWGVRKDGMPQGYQGSGKGRGQKVKDVAKRIVSNPDYATEKKAMSDRRAVRKNARNQIREINRNENEAIRNRKRDEMKALNNRLAKARRRTEDESKIERKIAKKERYRSAKAVSSTGEKALSAGLSIAGGLAVSSIVGNAVTGAISGIGAGTGSPEMVLAGQIIGGGAGAVAGILATRGINEIALPAIVGEPRR